VNHSETVCFLWDVADLIRNTFKRGKVQDVLRIVAEVMGTGAASEPQRD
jgi:hypothetical protein